MCGSIALIRRAKTIGVIVLCLVVILSYPGVVVRGDSGLSDRDKKNIVYDMYDDYRAKFPTASEITVEAAMELMQGGQAILVDIRRPAEMSVSMLPGAVTQTDFESNPERYSGLVVVAYCTIGYRSGIFSVEWKKKGVDVLNLKGGILAWVLEGGKVYAPGGKAVNRVHVYGKKWDLAPAGFESVMF